MIGLLFVVGVQAEDSQQWSFNAVVEVRISVPEGARTAEMFGTNRLASGVVIDNAGHVLTIGFQTLEAEKVEIVDKNDEPVDGTVVAYDSVTGFGLLRANKPIPVTPIPFGRSSDLKQGDPLFAAAYGGKEPVQGVTVMARKEFAGSWEYLLENAIFTTPAIENFSGAALIDRQGHLVGIGYLLSPLLIPDLGRISANMFVPIDILKPIIDDLKMLGRTKLPPRPWLGVWTEEIRGRLFVEHVRSGGPFEKAGIRSGDIILAVDQEPVQGMADFYRKVWALGKAGVVVPLTVLQGIQIRQIIVHSTARDLFRKPKYLSGNVGMVFDGPGTNNLIKKTESCYAQIQLSGCKATISAEFFGQLGHAPTEFASIFLGAGIGSTHAGRSVMTRSRKGIADDDDAINQQSLDNGHHGGFLAAAGISGSGEGSTDLVFHFFADADKFVQNLFQLGGHGAKVDR
jgi:S1-C subfamily serine protease